MAEYVTVMLANSKTSEQITAELSELIGPDYESSVTEWIFDSAIPEHYVSKIEGGNEGPVASSTAAAAPAAPLDATAAPFNAEPAHQVNSIETVQDSRDQRAGGFRQGGGRHELPNRPQGGPNGPRGGQQRGSGVFGSAITGLKREGDQSLERPNRRARLSETNGEGSNGGDRSIFDRAGVRPGGQAFGNGRRGQQQNHLQQQQQQQPMFGGGPQFGSQVVPGSVIQSGIPGLPPLQIPMNFNSLPPQQQQAIQQQIFQHQLIAAAAANQLFNPQAAQAIQQQPQAFPSQQELQQGYQQPAHAAEKQRQPRKPSKPVRLPDRPASEELCKYGVDCRNAVCHYSHPSPAATKESGLVLTKDVCEKNLECDDKVGRVVFVATLGSRTDALYFRQDCPKSHVSPAQKTDPEGKNIQLYTQKSAAAPAPVAPVLPLAAPNPGAKPCMVSSPVLCSNLCCSKANILTLLVWCRMHATRLLLFTSCQGNSYSMSLRNSLHATRLSFLTSTRAQSQDLRQHIQHTEK